MIGKSGFFFLLCLGLITSCQTDRKEMGDQYAKVIDNIRQTYAPDKRVAIYDVTFADGVLKGETNLPDAKKSLLDSLHDFIKTDSLAVLKPSYGLVNVSVCNIRSLPKHSAELSTQSLLGTILRIYKKDAGWYLVQTPDDYLGWLDSGALQLTDPEKLSRWELAKKVVVTESFDFIYAGREGQVVTDVVAGDILEAGDEMDGFRQVKLPDGRSGIISADIVISYDKFITLKEPLLNNILQTAHEMMGRPYLWGGTSGKAMDCSGFTKTVYYLNALELPRDASQQVQVGMEVEIDSTLQNLETGDLLFFGNKATATQKERITHVAMYLGDGKIIHASDRVQIESLKRGDPDFTERRLKTLVRAKRMLDNIGENGVKKLEEHPMYVF
ncbi:MAG: C40 family peptidase [Saprospiraceae bacterium]|nr:C40 family peptidase [Saprospiraceae bacterium]